MARSVFAGALRRTRAPRAANSRGRSGGRDRAFHSFVARFGF
jgi:hypothetical protein